MSTNAPKLSAQARRSLEERLSELETNRLPRLEREFEEARDPQVEAALRDTKVEARTLREALASAIPLEDQPHDPTIVEMGDIVSVRREGSDARERYTLVGELEARMDDSWISERAPLGAALLGGRVGHRVTVETPDGIQHYEVLAIEREG